MHKSTRVLKAITLPEGKAMTMNSKAVAESDIDLCQHCAFSEPFGTFAPCWVDRSAVDSLKQMGIRQQITYCAIHQPILSFRRPLVGFDATFNTFRPGLAWSSRISPKDVVGLMNETGELFGKAQITCVDSGLIDEMIDRHGKFNHLVLSDHTIDLKRVLLRLYGPQVIHDATQVSVIFMQRL